MRMWAGTGFDFQEVTLDTVGDGLVIRSTDSEIRLTPRAAAEFGEIMTRWYMGEWAADNAKEANKAV